MSFEKVNTWNSTDSPNEKDPGWNCQDQTKTILLGDHSDLGQTK